MRPKSFDIHQVLVDSEPSQCKIASIPERSQVMQIAETRLVLSAGCHGYSHTHTHTQT